MTAAATYDVSAAIAAAREAIDRADENVDDAWRDAADATVRRLALDLDHFTTDEVWRALDELPVYTHDRRAVAAVMRSAARNGVIAPVDSYRPSARVVCHGRPVRVWRSMLRARLNAF